VLHLRDGILGARVIWKRAPGVPDRANPHNLLPNCLDRCSFCAPCLSSCAARDYFWVVTRRVRRAPDRRASLAVPHDHHAILNVIPTGEHLSGVSVRRRSGLRLNSLWVRRRVTGEEKRPQRLLRSDQLSRSWRGLKQRSSLTSTSHRLDNCHCARRTKNSDE